MDSVREIYVITVAKMEELGMDLQNMNSTLITKYGCTMVDFGIGIERMVTVKLRYKASLKLFHSTYVAPYQI